MSYEDKEDAMAVESLDGLAMEGSSLAQTFSTSELEHLGELSHDLTAEMEHDGEEIHMIESEDMHEVVIQTTHDVMELEPEKFDCSEIKKGSLPPLRPLSIAPKPAKIPLTFKPVAGQQLLLLQGTAGGQPIKLLSPAPGLNFSNLSLGKPIAIKPAGGKNTLSVVQPKQLLMKKVMTQVPKAAIPKNAFVTDSKTGQQLMVVQKSEPQQQQQQHIKLIQTTAGTAISTSPKTLTLAQAQQMGILTAGTKLMPQSAAKQILLNKSQSKTLKLLPQTRSPTKILPAPQVQPSSKVTQRILLKPAGTGQSTTVLPSQLIQMTGGQAVNAGQLHQINIPGKGMQYIKFITTTQPSDAAVGSMSLQTTKAPAVGTKLIPITTSSNLKGNIVLSSDLKTVPKPATIVQKSQATTVRPVNISVSSATGGTQQVVVLPASYLGRTPTSPKVAIPAIRTTSSLKTIGSAASALNTSGDSVVPVSVGTSLNVSVGNSNTNNSITMNQSTDVSMEPNGMRPRKPCNCTKSQCLKLYCDCFANGEFCYMCNCMNCYNNLENEENRQRAIKNCLERNPNAFRPKIGKARDTGDAPIRKHTKGCNCKRSGCLKNYCECYEAKIACSSNCKCKGCRNIEDSMDKKSSRSMAISESSFSGDVETPRKGCLAGSHSSPRTRKNANKQAFNYITNDIIEATTQCLLTLAYNAEESEQDEETTKVQILNEFGQCLKQIIDCSISNNKHARAN